MPILYLAKVNVNSNIFDVYANKTSIENIKTELFKSVHSGSSYVQLAEEPKSKEIFNSDAVEYNNSRFSFQEIEKQEGIELNPVLDDYLDPRRDQSHWDGRVIIGKVVRSYEKNTEKLNPTTNKMEETTVSENVSIRFFFDLEDELITFCERQNFGFSQFMIAFSKLLDLSLSNSETPSEFEIYLQKDEDALNNKILEFESVKKVKATLVPPNSNQDDLKALAEEAGYTVDMKDANATRLEVELSSDNMAMESKTIKDMIKNVSKGYGNMTVNGIDKSGKNKTVSSSRGAAFTGNVSSSTDENEFNRESANLIRKLLEKIKARRKQ